MNIEVKTFRTVQDIELLRDKWTEWGMHPNADIDFYCMILAQRPEIVRPHVLAVYRDDSLDAILVGRIENASIGLNFGYSVLSKVHARRLTFIRGGFLGNRSPENGEALVSEVLRSAKQEKVDLVLFSHFDSNCTLVQVARRSRSYCFRDHAAESQAYRCMSVPPTLDHLYQRLSPKVRKNLKWQAKKLLGDFPDQVRIVAFTGMDDLDLMFQDIERIAGKTYQRGLGTGFEDVPEMRSRMKLLAGKGWLQSHVLYIGDQPAAFWVGTLFRGVVHSNFMGYDTAFSKYSVGMFLLLQTIKEYCDERSEGNIVEIDFGLGDAQYKEVLADRVSQECSINMFAPTPKGLWLNLLVTPPALANKWAKKLLAKTGMLQKVKKGWRRSVSKA